MVRVDKSLLGNERGSQEESSMSANSTQKKDNLVVKLAGSQVHIYEFVSELSKRYGSRVIETSKIKKNMDDDGFHLYMTITFPKEAT